MTQPVEVKELDQVVVRFSGDSGDGMQLAGNIFSTVSAIEGNSISTFPDYPADIRAPQGSLTGVSGFQVHIGAEQVYTPGNKCDVLVCMNAAALKTQYQFAKPSATIIIDTDSFREADLKKAGYTDEVIAEATGYAETVRVIYNPEALPLDELLRCFFCAIDPLSLNKQGEDEGTRYRTGVYYTEHADLDTIRQVFDEVQSEYSKPLAVELLPLENFFTAEGRHQDYLVKNPDGYCHLPLEMFSYAKKANRTEVHLRKAAMSDLDRISLIMTQAVDQMLREGKKQWDRTYPLPSDIEKDIERGVGTVLCRKAGPYPGKDSLESEEILSYAAVVYEGEKAYGSIEGEWISDLPYVVVHRLAVSDGCKKMGVASRMMTMIGEESLEKGFPSFRIDTNYDNFYMQKMLSTLGFTYTGKCFYPKGERLCYEKVLLPEDKTGQ